jgi:AcrR family transcriptional regulator
VSERTTNLVRPLPDQLADRIERAAQVFADNGLEATRIGQLADVTGIPRATLYYYFPSKQHILAHLLSRTLRRMTETLMTAAAVPGTGRERLSRLVLAHLRFIAEHGPTYRLLFSELGRAAPLVDIAAGVDVAILAPIRQALRDGHGDGSLQVDDVGAATSMVYGTVLVAGLQHLIVETGRDLDDHGLALFRTILSGISTHPTPHIEGDEHGGPA